MKLNVGCGFTHLNGFINLDINPDKNPDIVANCTSLPYEDNSMDEIVCGHLLEHLTIEDFEKTIKEMHRVLKPECKITVIIPDLVRGIECYNNGLIPWSLVQQICFGSEPKPELNHKLVLNSKVMINSLNPYFKDLKSRLCSNHASTICFWQVIIEGKK